MNKKKVKQEGSVFVIVLAIAVLALGATTFYFFIKSHKTATTTTASSTQSDAKATNETKSATTSKTETPSSDDTTTYEDPTWHYTFKYPKTWKLESKDGDTTLTSPDYKPSSWVVPMVPDGIGSVITISMELRGDIPTASYIDYMTRVFGVQNVTNLKIAGYDGIQATCDGGDGEFQEYLCTSFAYRTKSEIKINYYYHGGKKSIHKSVYSSILDTFSIVP